MERDRPEDRRLEVLVEVLREEMVRRGQGITSLSRRLGYAPAFLNNALTPGPRQRPRLRLETLLRLLVMLEMTPLELFTRVERRLGLIPTSSEEELPEEPRQPLAPSLHRLLEAVVTVWREEEERRAGAEVGEPAGGDVLFDWRK